MLEFSIVSDGGHDMQYFFAFRILSLLLALLSSTFLFETRQYGNAEWAWALALAQAATFGSFKDRSWIVPFLAATAGVITAVWLIVATGLDYWPQALGCLVSATLFVFRGWLANRRHSEPAEWFLNS